MKNYDVKVDGRVVARGLTVAELGTVNLRHSMGGAAVLLDSDTGEVVGHLCSKRGVRLQSDELLGA